MNWLSDSLQFDYKQVHLQVIREPYLAASPQGRATSTQVTFACTTEREETLEPHAAVLLPCCGSIAEFNFPVKMKKIFLAVKETAAGRSNTVLTINCL